MGARGGEGPVDGDAVWLPAWACCPADGVVAFPGRTLTTAEALPLPGTRVFEGARSELPPPERRPTLRPTPRPTPRAATTPTTTRDQPTRARRLLTAVCPSLSSIGLLMGVRRLENYQHCVRTACRDCGRRPLGLAMCLQAGGGVGGVGSRQNFNPDVRWNRTGPVRDTAAGILHDGGQRCERWGLDGPLGTPRPWMSSA